MANDIQQPSDNQRIVTYHGGSSYTAASGRVFEKGKAVKMNVTEAKDYEGRAGFNVDHVSQPRPKKGSLADLRARNGTSGKAKGTPPPEPEEAAPEAEESEEEPEETAGEESEETEPEPAEPEPVKPAPAPAKPAPKPAAPAKPAAPKATPAKPATPAKAGK